MSRPQWLPAALAAVALTLGGCSTVSHFAAMDDVHRLLLAVRNDDQAGFDAIVDQPSLAYSIELQRYAKANGLPAVRNFQPSPDVQSRRVPISAFRPLAAEYGYAPGRPVPPPGIAYSIWVRDYAHLCVMAPGRGSWGPSCLLRFADGPGGWRLVGIDHPERLQLE